MHRDLGADGDRHVLPHVHLLLKGGQLRASQRLPTVLVDLHVEVDAGGVVVQEVAVEVVAIEDHLPS